LLLSGLTYLVFLMPLGVATEVRYAYWSIMAVMLAIILSVEEVREVFRIQHKAYAGCISLLALRFGAKERRISGESISEWSSQEECRHRHRSGSTKEHRASFATGTGGIQNRR